MGTVSPRRSLASALLADARHRAGLTQAELARHAGVTRPLVSQYETGKKDPSVTTLARLVRACGMELFMHADPLSPAERAQAVRDAEVGPVEARRNAQRARHGLVRLRQPTPAELAALRG